MGFLFVLCVLTLIAYGALTYQRLLAQMETIQHNQKQIDIQLERRTKAYENLQNALRHAAEESAVTLLRGDLASAENKLAYATHSYNDSVELYQVSKKTFPANLVVSAFTSKLDVEYSCKS